MKIQKLSPDIYAKASALLRQAFPHNGYEALVIEKLHHNRKVLQEWVCIHRNTVIAYIVFSQAFDKDKVCGLHLGPLAVKPTMQNQGIGSELLRFSLRQDIIKENTIFVLGKPGFFQKFGFERCALPICPFDKKNTRFLSIRNTVSRRYTVGYEPEFGKP
jgi:putative acetyltransferase